MAEVANCEGCGDLAYLNRGLCQKCIAQDFKDMDKVRVYLKKNKGADFYTTVLETGVTEKKIKRYIKEGRIIATPNLKAFQCHHCGEPIGKGSLCGDCSKSLKDEVNKLEQANKAKSREVSTPTYKIRGR